MAITAAFYAVAPPSLAQVPPQMFKCGANYQDRPCAGLDVQRRYSGGRFDVDQVHPNTDRECAGAVAEVIPYWTRLKKGESMRSIQSEFDAKPIGSAEKSTQRELLATLDLLKGDAPREARGELENRCMAIKSRKGLPGDNETEMARARQERMQAYEAQRRAAEDRARARSLCIQNYGRSTC